MNEERVGSLLNKIYGLIFEIECIRTEMSKLFTELTDELNSVITPINKETREYILNSYINRAKNEEKDLSKEEKEKRDLFLENFGGER